MTIAFIAWSSVTALNVLAAGWVILFFSGVWSSSVVSLAALSFSLTFNITTGVVSLRRLFAFSEGWRHLCCYLVNGVILLGYTMMLVFSEVSRHP